jgi:diguanylate cyclase (GGDEF)-like protein
MARVLESRKRDQSTKQEQTRVLVVERDKSFRSSFVRSLGRRGLQVDTAGSRDEAVALVERHAYPVIVADPTLSEREGASLIDELRSRRPDASFIITAPEEGALPLGADEVGTCVLRKPWNERQLRSVLDTARESYRIRQQSLRPTGARVYAVLLIDDAVDTTQHLIALLQGSGVVQEIQHCSSLSHALRLLASRPFDVVVFNDQNLGALRIDAIEQLRAAARSVAVIGLYDGLQEGDDTVRARKPSKGHGILPQDPDILRKIILNGVDRKQKEAAASFLSLTDPLTQLASQAAFGERLEVCVASSRRAKSRCAVMLINLSGFRDLNAQYGHEAGDTVLCEVARRIQASVREEDAVARLSADEYAVLLTHVEEPVICGRVAQRILGITGLPVLLRDDLEVQLRARIGVSTYPEAAQSSDALLRRAHDALCAAKAQQVDFVLHTTPENPGAAARGEGRAATRVD